MSREKRIKIISQKYGIDKEALAAWFVWSELLENEGNEDIAEFFQDSYRGKWESKRDFAKHMANIPEPLQCYFNFQAYAEDLFSNTHSWVNGHVFESF